MVWRARGGRQTGAVLPGGRHPGDEFSYHVQRRQRLVVVVTDVAGVQEAAIDQAQQKGDDLGLLWLPALPAAIGHSQDDLVIGRVGPAAALDLVPSRSLLILLRNVGADRRVKDVTDLAGDEG